MLESFAVSAIVGVVLGFLAGLGIGGGSLLILWLTVILNVDYSVARGINLLFFLPSALIACVFRWHQWHIPVKKLLPGIAAGCAAAAVSSFFGTHMDLGLLKKLFGGLLLINVIIELLYKPKTEEP